ncbi:MAG: energy transducer TonB [Leptospiraceae bacterium]|nr:energy transducer TonB [Leptospiraceae bacterium]MDW7975992.1 energy transducer TonB [Leptospiraceae bacterium]
MKWNKIQNYIEKKIIKGDSFFLFMVLFHLLVLGVLFTSRNPKDVYSLAGENRVLLPVQLYEKKATKTQTVPIITSEEMPTTQTNSQTSHQQDIQGSEGNLQNHYVARVLQKIESKKQYPKVELFFGREGHVKVKIIIHKNGHLGQLEVIEGTNNNFIQETLNTIHRASPFEPFPAELQNKEFLELVITLKYFLE